MIIVFEGADGAGKTTLAKRLAAKFGLQYYHSGGPKSKQDLVNTLFSLEDMNLGRNYYLVDRHPGISELVYSAASGRQPICSVSLLKQSWDDIYMLVHCVAPKDEYQISEEFKSHKPDHHMKMVQANHEKIKSLYEDIFEQNTSIKSVRINTRDPESIAYLEKLIEDLVNV